MFVLSRRFWFASCLAFTLGCDRSTSQPAGSTPSTPGSSAADVVATIRTPEELHAALKAKNPEYNGAAQMEWNGTSLVAVDLRDTGVVDISSLAGLPLVAFFAENTKITDLSPLKNMRLVQISLNDSTVEFIGPLRGMPLQEVRLANTRVRDIGPLQGAPLQQLWLDNTPVDDISALAGSPLVSLTIRGTKVRSIGVVTRLPLLQRLNLAEAPVDDLSPVAGLPLTRLVFTPANVTRGLDAARSLPRCNEIGPSLEQMARPQAFWAAFDAGEIR